MKPPIIIVERGSDVSFYESIQDAELALEAIDVANGEYVAYDSEGCLLNLYAKKNKVFIEESEKFSAQAKELRRILLTFYSRLKKGNDNISSGASLEELVARGRCEKTPRVSGLWSALIFILILVVIVLFFTRR